MKAGYIFSFFGSVLFAAIIYDAIQRKRKNPPIFYKKALSKNYNARTIPPFGIFIKATERNNAELLNHELIHWQQYQKMGLVKYYRTYFRQMKEYGYDAHPMEIEARSNEPEYAKHNYTDAVRRGLAVTVYNPDFRKT